MDDKQEQSSQTQPGKAPEGHEPLPKALSVPEVLIDINVARKNLLIYPDNHIQVQRSLKRAFTNLSQVLNTAQPVINLTIVQNKLFVGKDTLESRLSVLKDFAEALQHHEIASVVFSKKISFNEFRNFLRLICEDSDHVRNLGGIEALLNKAGVDHIIVRSVDYEKLHITEEKTIDSGNDTGSQNQDGAVWHDFITHLVDNSLSTGENSKPMAFKEEMDPIQLAALINDAKIDENQFKENYEKYLIKKARAAADGENPDGKPTSEEARLNLLILELKPELRRQLLSLNFEHWAGDEADTANFDLIGGMDVNLVIEMLRQANTENREISPSLVTFLQQLPQTGVSSAPQPSVYRSESNEVIPAAQMATLMDREKYELYVKPEYQKLLNEISTKKDIVLDGEQDQELIQAIHDAMDETQLNRQVGHALMQLLEQAETPVEYESIADNILKLMEEFYGSGNFEFPVKLIKLLTDHRDKKTDNEIRKIASQKLNSFKAVPFIARLVEAYELKENTDDNAVDLISSLGSSAVDIVLNHYADRFRPKPDDPLYSLLDRFKSEIIPIIQTRLPSSTLNQAYNMVHLVERYGNARSAACLSDLLTHTSSRVRKKALITMVKLKVAGRVSAVLHFLTSPDPNDVCFAVRVIGRYRMKELVGDLIAHLNYWPITRIHYRHNRLIIYSLGRIGDPKAVEALIKLAILRWRPMRDELIRMKRVLYHSLSRYPYRSVVRMFKLGYSLKDPEITAICRNLSKQNWQDRKRTVKT
ncbi:MAG: HEAT repeat domain-containing protein [Desulfobacteraceae bacterium]|nr:HEAT repeat domain-containing protein [Desulfobacteraceae bacterium]